MGPIVLFDKSFLQSLSVDESVWFDHFFIANVCPVFFVEALADLEKPPRPGWTPEGEVAGIAAKFPELHGQPNVYHMTLCEANLLGHSVPMTGQILISGGRTATVAGKTGVVFDQPPETGAFLRWQNQQFSELERMYAKYWRAQINSIDLGKLVASFRSMGIDGKGAQCLADAVSIAGKFTEDPSRAADQVSLALLFLNAPTTIKTQILASWEKQGKPPLSRYAPYAAYVLKVDLFFQLALSANLIATTKPSNRMDIAYLYYLPFCMLFASSDKLHRTCAPLFLRANQSLAWGPDLKRSLSETNAWFKNLPTETRDLGITAFADVPPSVPHNSIIELWDKHLVPNWRELHQRQPLSDPQKAKEVREAMDQLISASKTQKQPSATGVENPNAMILRRRIKTQKGSWFQIPKSLRERNP